MTARFITAPDRLPAADAEEEHIKILIVDSDWHDIETIAFLCMTRQVKYDFYLFGPTSIDEEWLDKAAIEADTILVNGQDTGRHALIKEDVSQLNKAIVMNKDNNIKLPIDFIVKQLEEE